MQSARRGSLRSIKAPQAPPLRSSAAGDTDAVGDSDTLAAELSQCISQLSRQKMRELQMTLAGADAAETHADHLPVQSLLDLLTVRSSILLLVDVHLKQTSTVSDVHLKRHSQAAQVSIPSKQLERLLRFCADSQTTPELHRQAGSASRAPAAQLIRRSRFRELLEKAHARSGRDSVLAVRRPDATLSHWDRMTGE